MRTFFRITARRCSMFLPIRKSWQCRRRSHLSKSRDFFTLWALRAVINGRGDELIEVAKSNLLR